LNCKEWDTLPEAGGYLNQPARLMAEMEQAYRAWSRLTEYKRMQKTGGDRWQQWQKDNYDVVDMVRNLIKD